MAARADRPDSVRAFFAVDLAEAARRDAERVAQRLRAAPGSGSVSWVRPENYHATLRFLGSVPTEQLPELGERVRSETSGLAPFALRLTRLRAFPSLRRPRVLALALEPAEPLAALAAAVERACVACGFAPERRPFRAHVTLGRVREGGAPASELAIDSAPFSVGGFALFQSRLSPRGSVYTPLERFLLEDGAS